MRFVLTPETDEGSPWDEAKVKFLTGSDTISARHMGQNFYNFRPTHKLFVESNNLPALRNPGRAWRRRIHLIPFNLDLNDADADLEEKLRAEWPQILRWMLIGLADYLASGGLAPPEIVLGGSREYFDEQDELGNWLTEQCEPDSEPGFTACRDLFDDWRDWAVRSNVHTSRVGSIITFNRMLSEHRLARLWDFRRARLNVAKGYRGIRLKNPRPWREA